MNTVQRGSCVEDGAGVEARQEHHRRAVRQHAVRRDEQTVGVEQRERVQEQVVGSEAPRCVQRDRVRRQVALREHRSLRPTRRAARIEDGGEIVGPRVATSSNVVGLPHGERRRVCRAPLASAVTTCGARPARRAPGRTPRRTVRHRRPGRRPRRRSTRCSSGAARPRRARRRGRRGSRAATSRPGPRRGRRAPPPAHRGRWQRGRCRGRCRRR